MAKEETYFYKLAIDQNGKNFSLPGDAKWWRVQRLTGQKGAPPTVYTEDGPLQIKVEAPSYEELKEALRTSALRGLEGGRYKLIPVDAQGVQVGTKCAYTPPLEAESNPPPEGDDDGGSPSTSGINAVLIKFADRIAERDAKAIDQYVALANRYAAVAEKAIEALGNQNGHLTKGYVQVRPVTLDPDIAPDGDDGADEKDFFESVAGAAPAFAQLWNAFQAFQASRRENMAAAAGAAAAAAATVDTSAANGTNGANGVHVGIKRPTGTDDNGQGT